MISFLRKIIPRSIFKKLQPIYHYKIALLGAILYRFPSRKIKVVGITGTKGKTTTTELTAKVLEEAGFKVASMGTLQFKIGGDTKRNLYKMTMPGRFFTQKFLHDAVNAGCDWAVIEMTSEGAKQFRHKYIDLDALIVTNISPEHIESHGSYEKYVEAKLSIAHALEHSEKKNRAIIVNKDSAEAEKFLSLNIPRKYPYSLKDAGSHTLGGAGIEFGFNGVRISSPLPGLFNVYNMLGVATFARSQGIETAVIKKALEKVSLVRGRMERVTLPGDVKTKKIQDFTVIVDYAHTADSLEKVYQTFGASDKICVLGNTGGGRDKWKRPEMGKIADTYCSQIILTNEDPYDEDPEGIVKEMAKGMIKHHPRIIMDRREAIHSALKDARKGEVVIITGKGTDPYIMEANGAKTPWDDATIVREELTKILN
ncbi:MAG: UDP-N-acetylmuramyl-tripeptide synthetase [Candidatus Pacebacteria bacterium]|nr:UDP-N-acetylmuramyl-tripeptide synthetase [Candidatus Paceibacterota bacterium]